MKGRSTSSVTTSVGMAALSSMITVVAAAVPVPLPSTAMKASWTTALMNGYVWAVIPDKSVSSPRCSLFGTATSLVS